MKRIIALCDYKGRFGSKYFSHVYRQGMDKDLLEKCFQNSGYSVLYEQMINAPALEVSNIPVLYTSSEDADYRYKSFIEDMVLGVELRGAKTLPPFKFLRATNNKILMEQLRNTYLPKQYHTNTKFFGTLDELIQNSKKLSYPLVVKTAGGAVSRGVFKAKNSAELLGLAKKISRSSNPLYEFKDKLREFRHRGYRKESLHRKKFIVQEYQEGVQNDWKVLVYYDKVFILRRQNRPGDFRASGSGLFSFDDTVDSRLLDAAIEIRKALDIPMVSLDLAFKEDKVVLFEFQGAHFGTSTLEKSPYYYTKSSGEWQKIVGKSILEDIYARAIVDYLEKGN